MNQSATSPANSTSAPPDDRGISDMVTVIESYRQRVIDRFRPEFSEYAARVCGDSSAADAALERAFATAFDVWETCGPAENFRVWFCRILTSACHNEKRRVTEQA